MSGGWSDSFVVDGNDIVYITLKYRLIMASNYESDECGQALVAIDDNPVGRGAEDFLEEFCGDGNGGSDHDSGWQEVALELALPNGSHTLTVGGWNNKKTYNDELTDVFFDDIEITQQGQAPTQETSCTDSVDNDLDGLTDCEDNDCSGVQVCNEQPAPFPNQPPTLNLEANPSSGKSPLLTTFESNAFDPDGNIVEYIWDYDGNGTVDEITTSNPVEFIYITPGTYNATVEVVDNDGMSSSDSVIINVSPPPTPDATPTPTPSPAPEQDTGISDAPLKPTNKRIIIVAQDGSGDYTTIQAAVNASLPGDTIQVKNGTYGGTLIAASNTGTQALPITIINFSGHTPVIEGGKYTTQGGLPGFRVKANAEWYIIDGFEIRNSRSGFRMEGAHHTIRNNYIHDVEQQGIFGISIFDKANSDANNLLIEDNVIERSGSGFGDCSGYKNTPRFDDPGWVSSPAHCHAIYLSATESDLASTIRRNIFRESAGGGTIWLKGTKSAAQPTFGVNGVLIENNIFVDCVQDIALRVAKDNVIRNNTFITRTWPQTTNVSKPSFVDFLSGVKDNVIKNNIFWTNVATKRGFEDKTSTNSGNTLDYNTWNVISNTWKWQGVGRSDFIAQFKTVTGYETNGQCCTVNPLFVDIVNDDYHLSASSPAVDTGSNGECALVDWDGDLRPNNFTCDIGVDEFVP